MTGEIIICQNYLTKIFIQRVRLGCLSGHANEMNMVVPRINTVNGRKAIEYRGPSTWNRMEGNLKLIDKLTCFKSELLKRITPEFDNHPTWYYLSRRSFWVRMFHLYDGPMLCNAFLGDQVRCEEDAAAGR